MTRENIYLAYVGNDSFSYFQCLDVSCISSIVLVHHVVYNAKAVSLCPIYDTGSEYQLLGHRRTNKS